MKKFISIVLSLLIICSSLCANALDVDKAYYEFKEKHPDFVTSLIDGGIAEETIIAFIHDVYDYILEIDAYSKVTAENFEKNAMRAISDVSSREAYYSIQDTLLILYPDAIRLAVTEGKVAPEFQPLVETIKGILFAKESDNSSSGGNSSPSLPPAKTPTTEINHALFYDVPDSHWSYFAVQYLAENFILNGYLDGSFKPDANITRAEFSKIIISALNVYDNTADAQFVDVSKDSWYYGYVASAYKLGLITGYPDGSFKPDDNITRADICTIVNRALKYSPDGSVKTFSDDYLIPMYSRDSVYALAAKKIISGNPDGSFRPTTYATRAQTAKIIYAGFFQK